MEKNRNIKIVTIVGARPQFVKVASVSRQIAKSKPIEEVIVHTGQHFDDNMSAIFFKQLDIPQPKYQLGIHSLEHGAMTGRMLEEIEKVLLIEKPDWLLVYGDTNSTLAGALAAKKLHIKVAHVEAGLRSYNMNMPEEINRILTDRISDVLFCPTENAVQNLSKEGYDLMNTVVCNVGDVMYESALYFGKQVTSIKDEIDTDFVLATIHRAENTDDKNKIINIFKELDELNKHVKVVMPLHPRTKECLKKNQIETTISLLEPQGYAEMMHLIKKSIAVITDSGGLQKEAYFFQKRCFTLRDQTEWVELIAEDCNELIDVLQADFHQQIFKRIAIVPDFSKQLYGDGSASQQIIDVLQNY